MKTLRLFIAQVTRTRLSLIGAVVTTVTALSFIAVFIGNLFGLAVGPYTGIVTFLIFPTLFAIGLVLIALGLFLDRRRRKHAPLVLDLSSDRTRRQMRIFLAATILNLVILGVAAFKGVEVMEGNEFCGKTCHSVMQPEFTAYQRSPHARVRCVECHIGEGASWFVKSKLSGSWQVISVALDLYPRPIQTPVHDLRPARETCEHCHWPEKFVGSRLKVISRFQEDEKNTELKTVMMLNVGGALGGKSHGIHWHVDPRHSVHYRSDAKRSTVYEVMVSEEGKPDRSWRGPEADKPEAQQATTWRTMDCVDCHNRPAHIFRAPDDEIDRALAEGRLDRTLPWIKREALKALKQDYPTHEAARAGIRDALAAFYGKDAKVPADRVTAAAVTLGDIYASNIFPHMKIGWNNYPNHLGHLVDMGCLRCHNGDHKNKEGEVLKSDCDGCHTILADSEENPEILKTLVPGQE